MPELPEVETTRRGILPCLRGRRIRAVEVREPRLRWPVPPDLDAILRGEEVDTVERRGKYLLVRLRQGHPADPSRHVGQFASPHCAGSRSAQA